MIVYGVDESDDETTEVLENVVKEGIFSKMLHVYVASIERIRRLGRKIENKMRPVILKFLDHRDKASIMKACSKLKGSRYSVSEDFSKKVREIRKQLWNSALEKKSNGAKVKLLYDKLSVDSVMYGWDEEKGFRYRLKTNKRN